MFLRLLSAILLVFIISDMHAQHFDIKSPDENIQLKININEQVSFDITYKGKSVIERSTISLRIDGFPALGESPKLIKKKEQYVNKVLNPVVPNKSSKIKDEFNELQIEFKGNYQLTFRVYDDGIAYRFSTSFKQDIIVNNESFHLAYSNKTNALFQRKNRWFRITKDITFLLFWIPLSLNDSARFLCS